MATIPAETLPVKSIATAVGLTQGIGEIIGGVMAPIIGGRAADIYGLEAPLYIMVGLALLGTIIGFFLVETAPVKIQATVTA